MSVPRHPPICSKCHLLGHSKYNCPEGRDMINLNPKDTATASVTMCYNCGEDGHKRENCLLPPNPPEMQAKFKQMGVKAKRGHHLIAGYNQTQARNWAQRKEWQIEGANIPRYLIEKELEAVCDILEDFRKRTLTLRALRLLKSDHSNDSGKVISRKEEVAEAHAELRSFLPRIKQIINLAKGRRVGLNYLEEFFIDAYTTAIENLRKELVDFVMPETKN